jgi:hypothetical protein
LLAYHPEVAEGRLNGGTPSYWARVHAGGMIEAIGCRMFTQATVGLHVRDPRCLGDKPIRCTNPILYFAVCRHPEALVRLGHWKLT